MPLPVLPFGQFPIAGHADQPRFVLVYNTEDEAVPAFGLMECFDYEKETNAFLVRKPTVAARNNLIINDYVPVRSEEYGQGMIGLPAAVAFDGRAVTPEVGQVWGPVAGSWFLTPAAAGFTILSVMSAERGVVVVGPMPGAMWEEIEVTGDTPGGSVPADFYPGSVKALNLDANGWESQSIDVWWKDLNSLVPSPGFRYFGRYTGITAGRPLYLGQVNFGGQSGSGGAPYFRYVESVACVGNSLVVVNRIGYVPGGIIVTNG